MHSLCVFVSYLDFFFFNATSNCQRVTICLLFAWLPWKTGYLDWMLKLSEQYKLLLFYMVFSKCKQTQISCLFSYYRTTEFDVNISNSAVLFDAALFEKLAPKRCCCICFTHCLRFQKKIFLRFFMKRSKLNTRIREENSTEYSLQLRFFCCCFRALSGLISFRVCCFSCYLSL